MYMSTHNEIPSTENEKNAPRTALLKSILRVFQN